MAMNMVSSSYENPVNPGTGSLPKGTSSNPKSTVLWAVIISGAQHERTRSALLNDRKPGRVKEWKGMVSLVWPNQVTASGERLEGLLLRIKMPSGRSTAFERRHQR